jgi:hypothetical protein
MRVIGAEYGLAKGTICLTEAADGYYSRPHSLGLVEKASSLHRAGSIAPMVTPEDLPRARIRSPALGSGFTRHPTAHRARETSIVFARRKLATCNCDGRHSILVLTQPKLLNILLTDLGPQVAS